MTKTISLELSKRLIPFLKGVETEYAYVDRSEEYFIEASDEDKKHKIFKNIFVLEKVDWEYWEFKTLTLEEAIEFLTDNMWKTSIETLKVWQYTDDKHYRVSCNKYEWIIYNWDWKTLLQAIEKMLECLLDNNLLPKN